MMFFLKIKSIKCSRYPEIIWKIDQIIEVKNIPESGRVIFGATVTLIELSSKKKVTYIIVGEDEADVKKGKISYSSPMSKALIGKEEGETIKFETPSGFKEYEIVSTKHS